MIRSRFRLPVAAVAAVCVVAGCFAVSAKSAPKAGPKIVKPSRKSALALSFSHEVVVDEQRSGFEPDVSVGPQDDLYTSVPNGSSTTTSWIWQSVDHGNSFRIVPGNALVGRSTTCAQGGGDTEFAIDKGGNLFMSDLQNLTNLTNSVSADGGKTWQTSCAGAPNTPVDRMWYAVHGKLGDPDFRIYEEYDAVNSSAGVDNNTLRTGNQLVETVSTDGVVFAPVINANPGLACMGLGAVNCVTDNEGLPGNQVIAPNGDLLIAHTAKGGQIVVSRGHMSGTFPAVTATWHDMVINASLCPIIQTTAANIGKSETCGAANFPTIAEDTAGHFYVGFSSQPTTVQKINGSVDAYPTGPYDTYVVSSLDGEHWGKPVKVSSDGTNAFSWITAHGPGHVAIAWYHGNEASERPNSAGLLGDQLDDARLSDPHGYMLDHLYHAEFSIQVSESLNALSPSATWAVQTVSEHPVKYGPICTAGTACAVTQGDRSLGDFLEVSHDAKGALVFSYVDDTSGYYSVGPSGSVANSGPNVIVRQTGGPSLLSGSVKGPGSGPGVGSNQVNDPRNDAFYSANSMLTPAGSNLDLTAVSMSADRNGLVIRMHVADLSSLTPAAAAGGTTAEWITRFTTYDHAEPGNGHIYYAGMEATPDGGTRYFAGEPTRARYFTMFDSSTQVPGEINEQAGTITIHVPFAQIGDHGKGTTLYSVTAFTATAAASLAGNPDGVFNQLDATTPINYTIR